MVSVEYTASKVLRALLEDLARDQLDIDDGPGLRARTIHVGHGQGSSVLVPVWAGEGYPADVDAALTRVPPGLDSRENLVLVARHFSSGARAQLAGLGISWADASGNAEILTPQGLVVRAYMPGARPAASPQLRWTTVSGAIAELLLSSHVPETPLLAPLSQTARAIGVSTAIVSRHLKTFDAQGWTTKNGASRGPSSTRALANPQALLSAWAAWHVSRGQSFVSAHGPVSDPEEILERLLPTALTDVWWAPTGLAVLEGRAPFSTNVGVTEVYLDADLIRRPVALDAMLSSAGLRRVTSGPRIRLIEADPYLKHLSPRGPVHSEVTDIRLYGDLLGSGIRGEEAAEHLRRERIGF